MTSLPDLSLQVTWSNARRACVTGANFSGFYTYEIAKSLNFELPIVEIAARANMWSPKHRTLRVILPWIS